MTEPLPRLRKIDIILLAIIFAVGIFLRLPPHAFSPGAPLHSIAALHPQPAWTKTGFDEGLYREYVNAVSRDGLTSYPDIVEGYIDVQKKLPGSILPPYASRCAWARKKSGCRPAPRETIDERSERAMAGSGFSTEPAGWRPAST